MTIRDAHPRCHLRASAILAVAAAALSLLFSAAAHAGPVQKGIWVSLETIKQLPVSGSAWTRLKAAADGSLGTPNIADQDSKHDTNTLAVALVYARTGDAAYRKKAADAILSAIGTEAGGRTLALGRNLVSYVIAADLVNLAEYDPAGDQRFRSWLSSVRTKTMSDGRSLIQTHEERPNNWGTHAGASRIAADLYLGDSTDLARAAQVFNGWLGDRSAYAGFKFGDLWWQADPRNPVAINKPGTTIQGHSVDGVLADDQRRSGGFAWPPPKENYVWEALQGAVVQAQLLTRAGYPAWQWEQQALLRAVTWLYQQASFPAQGDDTWQPWLINAAYGTSFPTSPASAGKNMGWTDWTNGGTASSSPTPTPAPTPTPTPTPAPSPAPAPAGPVTTFTAVADALVKSSYPTKNYGGDTILRVRTLGTDGTPEYRTYLTFTLTGLSGAPASAKLRLYVTDRSRDSGALYLVSNPWAETTITWATAPTPTGGPIATLGQTPATGTWMEIDLSSVITANGTYSLLLISPSTDSAYFSSREGGNAPQLAVTTA